MDIEKEKKRVELLRVQAAYAEMNLSILQKMEEIERVKTHMEIQKKKETELKQLLEGI